MKRESISDLPRTRTGFDALSLYEDLSDRCVVDLSDNTNLWGMPPAAEKALARFSPSSVRGYPSAYTPALKEAFATYAGVDANMIVTGCGSDDVLDAAIRAFGNPGSRLSCCEPTFSMIPVLAKVNGLALASSEFDDDWNIPVDSLLSSGPDIVYVCSPNNPTGTSATVERIEAIAESFPGLVIVDQAYAEYSATSLTPLATRYSNVLITRTMSKVFGMAGLRLGYGIGNPGLVCEVEKSRGPYKVTAIAEAAAIAAIDNDLPWISNVVTETLSTRMRVTERLVEMGHKPLPADANFVLLPIADAPAVAARLARNGVATRAFSNLAGIGDALRVTIGPWEMMQRFLDSLEASVA
jgi:histidinol-phosphate aminotransferase